MSTMPKPTYSPSEYLAMERASEERHEYFPGEIFAMSGASRSHNLIGVQLSRLIAGSHEGKGLRIVFERYASKDLDQRSLHVSGHRSYLQPPPI